MIGDASLSIKDKDILCYTDTGRSWHPMKHNVKDFILTNSNVKNTDDLIDLITKLKGGSHLYLSIHPNRWSDDALKWFLQFTEDCLETLVKWVIKLWAVVLVVDF